VIFCRGIFCAGKRLNIRPYLEAGWLSLLLFGNIRGMPSFQRVPDSALHTGREERGDHPCFSTTGRYGSVLFSEKKAVFLIRQEGSDSKEKDGYAVTRARSSGTVPPVSLTLRFLDTCPDAVIEGGDLLPWRSHFFIGRDPGHWMTDVPNYSTLLVKSLYPGIDLIYKIQSGRIKYEFVVSPGADPELIRFTYDGASPVFINTDQRLALTTPAGCVYENAPYAYQIKGGTESRVPAGFVLSRPASSGTYEISFHPMTYDTAFHLVIDPELVFSTYLGGLDNEQFGDITVNDRGDIFITGMTTSVTFPVTPGSYQDSVSLPPDYPYAHEIYLAFLTKLTADGKTPVFSTYLGGLSYQTQGEAVAVDGGGNIYVAGWTRDSGFPVTEDAFQTLLNNESTISDAFVTKLNPAGSTLVYSTFIGGSGDDAAECLCVDAAGNAWTGGSTESDDFPASASAYQDAPAGLQTDRPRNGFVLMLDAAGHERLFATYFGGNGNDIVRDVHLAGSGYLDLLLQTDSDDLPVFTGTLAVRFHGDNDIYIARMNAVGSALLTGTYLGGQADDYASAMVVDPDGNYYIAGATESPDFPVTDDALDTLCESRDAFVASVASDLKSIRYATLIGGEGLDSGSDLALAPNGDCYVAGITFSNDFPVTPDALYPERNPFHYGQQNECSDGFLLGLDIAKSSLFFSSFWGGERNDRCGGVALDHDEYLVIAGETESDHFPITDGAFDTWLGMWVNSEVFVSKLQLFNVTGNADIRILNPAGTGIVWKTGHTYPIQWESDGYIGDHVRIDLFSGDDFRQTITQQTDNDGYKTWTIPAILPEGAFYRIKISAAAFPDIMTFSPFFTVETDDTGGQPEMYLAPQITTSDVPVLDGRLDDALWHFLEKDSLLRGGAPGTFHTAWTQFEDNLVVWKAAWCESTNRIYVAAHIQDDIRGTFDNRHQDDYYYPFEDESIEFYTDGDGSGGDYWARFDQAQRWRVSGLNEVHLADYPAPQYYPALYMGDALKTAVTWEDHTGNWNCEAVFTIYTSYPDELKYLNTGDIIGWEIWYADSDDEHFNGRYYQGDHITGWNMTGEAWKNADYFGRIVLGDTLHVPKIILTSPADSGACFYYGDTMPVKWTTAGNTGTHVTITLYQEGVRMAAVQDSTSNDGTYYWIVPAALPQGEGYQVRVASLTYPFIWDQSDFGFSVRERPGLVVTHPDSAGIHWEAGQVQDIQWMSIGDTGDSVSISLYRDFVRCFVVAGKTENDGLYNWFVPDDLEAGPGYRIRVQSGNDSTVTDYSDSTFSIVASSDVTGDGGRPATMALFPNYPNPFNPVTAIRYSVSETVPLSLWIADASGRYVQTLVDRVQPPGMYTVRWDGRDTRGRTAASGVYVVIMEAGQYRLFQKMLYLH